MNCGSIVGSIANRSSFILPIELKDTITPCKSAEFNLRYDITVRCHLSTGDLQIRTPADNGIAVIKPLNRAHEFRKDRGILTVFPYELDRLCFLIHLEFTGTRILQCAIISVIEEQIVTVG